MTPADIIAALETKFDSKITEKNLEAQDPYAVVAADDLFELCQYLYDYPQLKFEFLNCITGVDYLEPNEKKAAKAGFDPHVEVVYHLQSFTHQHRITIKVMLPRWKDDVPGNIPEVPSVTSLWKTADWHEREVYDLSGVLFTGHPNMTRILLAEDWEGYPLRKDYEFPLEYHGIRGR